MKNQLTAAIVFIAAFLCGTSSLRAGDGTDSLAGDTAAALKKAATFYRSQVARHGGYVYFYSVDLKQRFGEGVASPDQIWVQPPGTPTVGMAYLRAFEATKDQFYLDAATEAAEALIYGQLESGAWTNCIDFNPRGERVARYRNGQGRGRNFSSLDDGQSQSAIRFLIRADRAHEFKHEAIHVAASVALDALLHAQFQNGAFPQGWVAPVARDKRVLRASFPDYDWRTEGRIKNYWDMYTLNDGLAGTVSKALIEAHQSYGDARYKEALARLGDFLLLAQLPEPQPAWAQQYSYEMHPIWARRFEPAAVAGRESEDVLETLMTIYEYTGDAKYLEPLPAAISYLRRSLLPDGRLARYYELQSNRPLYMQRRAGVYSLTYDDANLPDHYGWKTDSRLDAIETRYKMITAANSRATGPSSVDLAQRAQAIIDALDAQGRWISTFAGEPLPGDQKFRPGDRYISSAVFSENIETLSEFLKVSETTTAAVEGAVRRALPLLEKGAAGSADQRRCFTCHNQALPVMALAEARKRAFAIDRDNLERQLRHTEAHLERGRMGYLEGRGQGGQVITAGYALWTLEAGDRNGNETTAAVTHYLLEYQKHEDRWRHRGRRPPTSGSDFTTTYVALRGLAAFGTEEQRSRMDARTQTVGQWLLAAEPHDNEDRVFRLRALAYVGADDDARRQAVAALLERQRDDGGWAQTDEMQSDPYATATALVALLRDGGLAAEHPAVGRGVQYLLDTQLEDGSWHVVTRAQPFQTYFESGFPHGKDQFISISASSWATLALLLTLPESP